MELNQSDDTTPKTFTTDDVDEDIKRDYITGFKEHFNGKFSLLVDKLYD